LDVSANDRGGEFRPQAELPATLVDQRIEPVRHLGARLAQIEVRLLQDRYIDRPVPEGFDQAIERRGNGQEPPQLLAGDVGGAFAALDEERSGQMRTLEGQLYLISRKRDQTVDGRPTAHRLPPVEFRLALFQEGADALTPVIRCLQ